jgi:soluble lytic murein transglycosylase-like protein
VRLQLDRLTLALLVAGVVMLNALLFIAGAIVGTVRGEGGEGVGPQASGISRLDEPAQSPRPGETSQTPEAPSQVIASPSPPPVYEPVRLNVRYEPIIRSAAERHNVSPVLVAAVARVESDFDPFSHSHKNARGVMQVIPETGARFGVSADDLFDPERNIGAGTAYLAWLLDRYRGDVDLALAAYNAGEGAVDKYRGIPPYRETQQYVRKVRKAFYAMQERALRN